MQSWRSVKHNICHGQLLSWYYCLYIFLNEKLTVGHIAAAVREGFSVFKIERKKPNMVADIHCGEECYRYREGNPLYVTHFLYHIPRLYCISSECFSVCHKQLLAELRVHVHVIHSDNRNKQCRKYNRLFIWLQLLMLVLML